MAKEEDAERVARSYVRRLARNITVRRAILTGSRATGSYLEDSDVDLIIVSDDFSKMALPDRLRYLQKRWTSRIPLEAFGYTMDEFRMLQHKSTYVKEAVQNGIVLVGEQDPSDPIFKLSVGSSTGKKESVARNHDKYLYGGKPRSS